MKEFKLYRETVLGSHERKAAEHFRLDFNSFERNEAFKSTINPNRWEMMEDAFWDGFENIYTDEHGNYYYAMLDTETKVPLMWCQAYKKLAEDECEDLNDGKLFHCSECGFYITDANIGSTGVRIRATLKEHHEAEEIRLCPHCGRKIKS